MYIVISGTLLLIYAAIGFYRGMVASLLHLLSTIFAIWMGLQFYQPLNHYMRLFIPFPKTDAFDANYAIDFAQPERYFNTIISLLMIIFIVKVMTHMVLDAFSKLIYRQRNVFFLRIFGVIISLVSGVIALHFLLLLMALYPDSTIQSSLQHARLAKWLITELPLLSPITLNLT